MSGLHNNLISFFKTLPMSAQYFLNAAVGVLLYLLGENVGASFGKAVFNFYHS